MPVGNILVADDDAAFVLVFSGAVLLGGMAFAVSRSRRVCCLRVLGHGPLCPDHIDLVALPGAEEVAKDVGFVNSMKEKHKLDDLTALTRYCLLLLNTNEFVYLD